ncbi:hypothetical protein M231_05866 [Tremella mesenterica]|uniref:Uncharacterized protein n=1 Tax=Tremella mesenterica TaxID=5217 RepID=A0A4Q1BH31_TREME|nr:hypothetical protein M231_05866 [Tremella mesenterica]
MSLASYFTRTLAMLSSLRFGTNFSVLPGYCSHWFDSPRKIEGDGSVQASSSNKAETGKYSGQDNIAESQISSHSGSAFITDKSQGMEVSHGSDVTDGKTLSHSLGLHQGSTVRSVKSILKGHQLGNNSRSHGDLHLGLSVVATAVEPTWEGKTKLAMGNKHVRFGNTDIIVIKLSEDREDCYDDSEEATVEKR